MRIERSLKIFVTILALLNLNAIAFASSCGGGGGSAAIPMTQLAYVYTMDSEGNTDVEILSHNTRSHMNKAAGKIKAQLFKDYKSAMKKYKQETKGLDKEAKAKVNKPMKPRYVKSRTYTIPRSQKASMINKLKGMTYAYSVSKKTKYKKVVLAYKKFLGQAEKQKRKLAALDKSS